MCEAIDESWVDSIFLDKTEADEYIKEQDTNDFNHVVEEWETK